MKNKHWTISAWQIIGGAAAAQMKRWRQWLVYTLAEAQEAVRAGVAVGLEADKDGHRKAAEELDKQLTALRAVTDAMNDARLQFLGAIERTMLIGPPHGPARMCVVTVQIPESADEWGKELLSAWAVQAALQVRLQLQARRARRGGKP